MPMWRRTIAVLVALAAVLLVHTLTADLDRSVPANASTSAVPATSAAPAGQHRCPGPRDGHDPTDPSDASQAPSSPTVPDVAPVVVSASLAAPVGVPLAAVSADPTAPRHSTSLLAELCVLRI